ncbi:MAG: MBL fold metallo-hydrolase [Thermoplasmata archaeon]|nr:MAG: MBL fold metallo-hydrolase [Thermoplasmata archaeon]
MNIMILGSGQDAGIPHTGCFCDICNEARDDPKFRRLGPSIAIFDKDEGFCYLIDSSPDFKYQLDMIKEEEIRIRRTGETSISGILLTHAHFGHCSGLWHLDKEALEEIELPIFCTKKMKRFLSENHPFSLLVQRKNIEINEILPNKSYELDGLNFIPTEVPHRNEISDTVGYIMQSKKRVVYIPDVDHWTDEVIDEIKISNIAIIDGTFYSRDEIPRYEEVPHPPIEKTLELLENIKTEIFFTHINHTNKINTEGKERKNIEDKGHKIAYDGMILEI